MMEVGIGIKSTQMLLSYNFFFKSNYTGSTMLYFGYVNVQRMLTPPRHLIPPLVYPEIRVYPMLLFVFPTRLITVCHVCHFILCIHLSTKKEPDTVISNKRKSKFIHWTKFSRNYLLKESLDAVAVPYKTVHLVLLVPWTSQSSTIMSPNVTGISTYRQERSDF
jgi:hypothetical protein